MSLVGILVAIGVCQAYRGQDLFGPETCVPSEQLVSIERTAPVEVYWVATIASLRTSGQLLVIDAKQSAAAGGSLGLSRPRVRWKGVHRGPRPIPWQKICTGLQELLDTAARNL